VSSAEAQPNLIANMVRVQKDNMHIFVTVIYNLVTCNLLSCGKLRLNKSIGSFSCSRSSCPSAFHVDSTCSSKRKTRLNNSVMGEYWRHATRCRSKHV